MTIPSNIVYFIFGFISCFALVVIVFIQIVRSEHKKRQEFMNAIIKDLTNNEIKSIDEDKDE